MKSTKNKRPVSGTPSYPEQGVIHPLVGN